MEETELNADYMAAYKKLTSSLEERVKTYNDEADRHNDQICDMHSSLMQTMSHICENLTDLRNLAGKIAADIRTPTDVTGSWLELTEIEDPDDPDVPEFEPLRLKIPKPLLSAPSELEVALTRRIEVLQSELELLRKERGAD